MDSSGCIGKKFKKRRLTVILFPIMTLCVLGMAMSAFAEVDEIIPISDFSPYPPGVDCNGTHQTGTVWRNSESEPHMDVDFGRPDRMAAIVHQDRWSNGSAQSNATFYSDDGGLTWELSFTPITRCSGGLRRLCTVWVQKRRRVPPSML